MLIRIFTYKFIGKKVYMNVKIVYFWMKKYNFILSFISTIHFQLSEDFFHTSLSFVFFFLFFRTVYNTIIFLQFQNNISRRFTMCCDNIWGKHRHLVLPLRINVRLTFDLDNKICCCVTRWVIVTINNMCKGNNTCIHRPALLNDHESKV